MKLKALIGSGIIVGSLAVSSVAGAAVVYDPLTGGFAGKGDVQLALGMNNNELQTAVQNNALTFTYEDTVEYDVPCVKDNNKKILRTAFKRSSTVTGTVEYEPRKKNQVSGFNLDPMSAEVVEGDLSCPNGWEPDGDPALVNSSGGGLLVNGVSLQ